MTQGAFGTLLVTVNGTTGGVCDDHFNVNDGKVFCRMMGKPTDKVEFIQYGPSRSKLNEHQR